MTDYSQTPHPTLIQNSSEQNQPNNRDFEETVPIIKKDATVQIMEMFENSEEDMSLLECTAIWMEENGFPVAKANVKYIPKAIIEKIKLEVLEDDKLRPSEASLIRTTTLEGFFE